MKPTPQRRLATLAMSLLLTHLSVLSRGRGSVTAHEGGPSTLLFSGAYVAARRRHGPMMLILTARPFGSADLEHFALVGVEVAVVAEGISRDGFRPGSGRAPLRDSSRATNEHRAWGSSAASPEVLKRSLRSRTTRSVPPPDALQLRTRSITTTGSAARPATSATPMAWIFAYSTRACRPALVESLTASSASERGDASINLTPEKRVGGANASMVSSTNSSAKSSSTAAAVCAVGAASFGTVSMGTGGASGGVGGGSIAGGGPLGFSARELGDQHLEVSALVLRETRRLERHLCSTQRGTRIQHTGDVDDPYREPDGQARRLGIERGSQRLDRPLRIGLVEHGGDANQRPGIGPGFGDDVHQLAPQGGRLLELPFRRPPPNHVQHSVRRLGSPIQGDAGTPECDSELLVVGLRTERLLEESKGHRRVAAGVSGLGSLDNAPDLEGRVQALARSGYASAGRRPSRAHR